MKIPRHAILTLPCAKDVLKPTNRVVRHEPKMLLNSQSMMMLLSDADPWQRALTSAHRNK